MEKHFQDSLVLHFQKLQERNAHLNRKVAALESVTADMRLVHSKLSNRVSELEQANTSLTEHMDLNAAGFRWWPSSQGIPGRLNVYVPNGIRDFETAFVSVNGMKMPAVRMKFKIWSIIDMKVGFSYTLASDFSGFSGFSGAKGTLTLRLLFFRAETFKSRAAAPQHTILLLDERPFDVRRGGIWFSEQKRFVWSLIRNFSIMDLFRWRVQGPGGSLCLRFEVDIK